MASLMGIGSKSVTHGCRYPPQASGCLKIKMPIHKKVMARPTLKMWNEVLFIIIFLYTSAKQYYNFHQPNCKRRHQTPKTPCPYYFPLQISKKQRHYRSKTDENFKEQTPHRQRWNPYHQKSGN